MTDEYASEAEALTDAMPPPELQAIAVLIRERDEAIAEMRMAHTAQIRMAGEAAKAQADLAVRTGQLQASRRHVSEADESEGVAFDRVKRAIRERDLARAELASARQELELLRAQAHWIVARYCERCEREVLRGESYGLEPGTGGLVHHIHCPDQPEGAPA